MSSVRSDDRLTLADVFLMLLLDSEINNAPRLNGLLQLFSKQTLNLLLLGKTGHGKSATGNTTLGRKEFLSKASVSSVTSKVKCAQVDHGSYLVNIVDSPGLADTESGLNKVQEMENVIENMKKAIDMCHGVIHAFLFVVKFGNRFTNEDKNTLDNLRQIFGLSFLRNHGVILFTHGDMFEGAMEDEDTPDKDFSEWCREQRGALRDLMTECGNRCVLFNNTEKNVRRRHAQMDSLIQVVVRLDTPYTFLDYISSSRLRVTLIVKLKEPQLRAKFNEKIKELRSVLRQLCETKKKPTEAGFRRFEASVEALKMEINAEDRNTGVLVTTYMDLLHLEVDVEQHKQRLIEESESGCSIL